MKAAAIILIVLVLAAVGGLGWLCFSAVIDVRYVSCIATDTVTQLDFYNDLTDRIAAGTFVGTRFTQETPGPADRYQFLTYTVRAANRSFLKAEVMEIRITPMDGDVLQLGDDQEHSLSSGRETDLSVTLLTSREMHSVREATVSYYIWGLPFTTRLTLGR